MSIGASIGDQCVCGLSHQARSHDFCHLESDKSVLLHEPIYILYVYRLSDCHLLQIAGESAAPVCGTFKSGPPSRALEASTGPGQEVVTQ